MMPGRREDHQLMNACGVLLMDRKKHLKTTDRKSVLPLH